MVVRPGYAAGETARHLELQLLDGHDVVVVDLGTPGPAGDVVQTMAEGGQRTGREEG